MMEENTVKLKDFLERHGARLGEKIEQNLTPAYNPLHPEGVEEYGRKMLTLMRKPGLLSASLMLAPCRSAMAATRLKPRPLPGVERARSKR